MVPDSIGRYKIIEELGSGGASTVYRAYDPSFDREVAVKVLPRKIVHSDKLAAALTRFRRELKTIASLEHPTIVPVYDVGETDTGQPFFVMRFMAGGSLVNWIKNGPMPPEQIAHIVEKLASALNYAHQKQIFHRDIKPENVMFDVEENPYLTDFGIAKLSEAGISVTDENAMAGSPAYLSPEQLQGGEVDARTDVYSMGVMIYEMLTGQKPYKTDSSVSTALSHITRPVPDLASVKPDLPPEVAVVVKTAMAKDRKERYSTPIELSTALSLAVFGSGYTMPGFAGMPDNQTRSAGSIWGWISAGILLLIGLFIWLGMRGQLPFLSAVPTATATLTQPPPPVTTTSVPTVEPTFTPVPPTPTAMPIPGGADSFAFLSGNQIYLMNFGEAAPIPVRTENSAKYNLQWMPGGKSLVFTSGLCVYELDIESNETREIVCFSLKGTEDFFESFRVSPDGKLAAITVSRALYIVPFDRAKLTGSITKSDLISTGDFCKYSYYAIKDIRWSADAERLAALVVDTQASGTEQVYLLDIDIPKCKTVGAIGIDRFPFQRFTFKGPSIPSFDWNGGKLFLVNDTERNDGFGNLYLYDSETKTGTKINPISGNCCYRDARFSPDGSHILFAFQRYDSTRIQLYYIPFAEIGQTSDWKPIPGLDIIFRTPRDKPQPVLRPIPK